MRRLFRQITAQQVLQHKYTTKQAAKSVAAAPAPCAVPLRKNEMTNPFLHLPPPPPKQETTLLSSLDELDLSQELLQAYNKAKTLLSEAEYDESIPLNQKSRRSTVLQLSCRRLQKTQETLHNTQTVTKIEAVLINTLKNFPEIREEFLAAYEAAL